jgi:WD40 repeat protein
MTRSILFLASVLALCASSGNLSAGEGGGNKENGPSPLPPSGLRLVLEGNEKGDDQGTGKLALTFAANDSTLAAGGPLGQTVRVWDLPSGLAQHRQRGEFRPAPAGAVLYSPDGKLLAVADVRKAQVTLHDPATGEAKATLEAGDRNLVRALSFSGDGRRLAGLGANEVKVWDVGTGKETHSFTNQQPCLSLALSPDGRLLALGLGDAVRLWDLERRTEVGLFKAHAGTNVLGFSPDGKTLAIAAQGVQLWDVARKQQSGFLHGGPDPLVPLAYSPDGKWLAAAEQDGIVRLWDLATGEKRAALPVFLKPGANANETGLVPYHRLSALAFSNNSRMLAACSRELVRVWDVAQVLDQPPFRVDNHLARHILRAPPDTPRAFAFSPDGQTVAAGGDASDHISLYEASTGKEWIQLAGEEGKRGWCGDIGFAPDGKSVAATLDGTVYVWGLPSGKRLAKLPSPVPYTGYGLLRLAFKAHAADSLRRVAFAADGRRLASVGKDGSVKFWDVAKLKQAADRP